MADIREQRIYCAEQIYVPENLPVIMKHYSKAVIRSQPEDLVEFSQKYFESLIKKRETGEDQTGFFEIAKPSSHQIPKE